MASNDSNVSYREFARRIEESQTLLSIFLADIENYGTKKCQGRKPKLANMERRIIIRKVARKEITRSR